MLVFKYELHFIQDVIVYPDVKSKECYFINSSGDKVTVKLSNVEHNISTKLHNLYKFSPDLAEKLASDIEDFGQEKYELGGVDYN